MFIKLVVIALVLCLFLLKSSSLVEAFVICPPRDAISPCTCSEYSAKTNTTTLYCNAMNLIDSQASAILDAYLTTPNVSPVGVLYLSGNSQLARIPVQVKYFTTPAIAYLYSNSFTSIESGAFNFADDANPLLGLSLQQNELMTIAPGAFKGFHFSFLFLFSFMSFALL